MLKDFQFLQTIGKGKTSDVLLSRNKDNKMHYAVKIFRKLDMIKKDYMKRISWEVRINSNLKSQLFPKFYGTSQTSSEFFLFMEYIPGGDFYYWETNFDNISITSGQFYIGQIILMLENLHGMEIIYRDLKPENLILGADGYLRLIDFGSSTVLSSITNRTYTLCGTPEFLSPEVLLKKGHNKAVDYWALGIFIYELFTKQGPFFDEDPLKLYINTIKVEYKFTNNFPEKAKTIVRGLLVKSPHKRLGMIRGGIEHLKNNSFFKDFNWTELINRKMNPPIIPKVKNDRDISNFPKRERCKEKLQSIDVEKDPFYMW